MPILMYHEIAPPSETDSHLAVSPEAFARQLEYLHDEGFHTVTADEVATAVAGGAGTLPDRAVALTFDDGFADFHSRALPLLGRYGFTATVFVTTGWVQDAGPLPAGQRPGRMLSWSQIEEAARERDRDRRAQPPAPAAGPAAAGPAARGAVPEQGEARGQARVAGPGPGLSVRLLQRRRQVEAREVGHRYGCAVGNLHARRRTRPFRPAPADGSPTNRDVDVRATRPGQEPGADLPHDPGTDQGVGGREALEGRLGWHCP